MSSKKNIHVTPRDEGGWSVRREGASRASSNHATQAAAAAEGRATARREEGEFFLHGRDGQIRSRDSYGNDPHPPEGLTDVQHLKSDLGQLRAGSTVMVTLKQQANVLLMDANNYRKYSSGRGGRVQYYGGLAKRSPARIKVPRSGHWYLAVDLGGHPGKVSAAVAVEPPPRGSLPPIKEPADALRGLRNTQPEVPPVDVMGGQTWDVFISHAGEDKEAVARPLAEALRAAGVSVWLDVLELRIGDSLRRKIDQGIRSSRFGVVVCSTEFFAKGWPQYELDGLVTRTVAGEQNLLPIWHGVTREEVMAQSPSLADKVALSTGVMGVQEIAEEIAAVVLHDDADVA